MPGLTCVQQRRERERQEEELAEEIEKEGDLDDFFTQSDASAQAAKKTESGGGGARGQPLLQRGCGRPRPSAAHLRHRTCLNKDT